MSELYMSLQIFEIWKLEINRYSTSHPRPYLSVTPHGLFIKKLYWLSLSVRLTLSHYIPMVARAQVICLLNRSSACICLSLHASFPGSRLQPPRPPGPRQPGTVPTRLQTGRLSVCSLRYTLPQWAHLKHSCWSINSNWMNETLHSISSDSFQ